MLPFVSFFGYQFPTYTLMIILALIFGFLFLFLKRTNIAKEDVIYSTLYALLFFVIGGKLLYLAVTFLQLKISPLTLTLDQLMEFLKGGYVWYGAFFGGLFGYFLYCKQYQVAYRSLIDDIMPVFPLVHFFGRLGCFCAGCCYGIPYPEPIGVNFKPHSFAPQGISLFPVQLLEAFFNLILFFVLLRFASQKKRRINCYSVYAISYGLFRFLIEYLRYDSHRGFFLCFSTSQWGSIVLFISGCCFLFGRPSKTNDHSDFYQT
ncbi:MAG TPA: prolipoprotein diacylglyceryl transferase [Thermotogota bacterium]|nr:prolipoprotein diacylglyceryl transferase [Thermotogota bacterium]HRW35143.1 prolipoprotein diacylglyceryl transferase [Thermotogota bacterium]